MENRETFKIYPTVDEIKMIDSNRYCPVVECKKLFTNLRSLICHLRQHLSMHPSQRYKHCKKDSTEGSIEFHCPVDGCLYAEISPRFFKNMKHLRQHFWKVHAEKTLFCDKCKKGFPQQSFLDAHLRECEKIFKCECGVTYPSYEGLITHARRKQHSVPQDLLKSRSKAKEKSVKINCEDKEQKTKIQPLIIVVNGKSEPTVPIDDINKVFKPRLLLPKPAPLNSLPLPTVAAIALSELSNFREIATKSTTFTQTESKAACGDCSHCSLSGVDNKNRHSKKSIGCSIKRSATVPMESCISVDGDLAIVNNRNTKRSRRTTETQTRVNNSKKQGKTCAETQTGGEFILEKAMAVADLPILKVGSEGLTNSASQNNEEQSIEISTTVNELCETSNISEQFGQSSENIFEFSTSSTSPRRENLQETSLLPSVNSVDSFTEMASKTCSPILNHPESGTSSTEKDVLLGVVNHPFTLNHTCKNTLSNSQTNEIFSSGSLQDCRSMTKRCNRFSYEGLFDSRPCDSPKLGEILRFSIETQTELDIDNFLLGEESDSDDSILCFNIQTQTSDDLESIPYDQLLTNMQTQTNEEYLFPELSFSDIQTQTTWNDILPLTDVSNQTPLVHIQTQTNVANAEIQSANSETQTLLDSYDSNCAELTDSHTQTTWSCLQDLVSGL